MSVPFHPLNYANWKEYLCSEEVKQSVQQRESAYNQFFAIFPYSTNVWLQYADYFASDSDKLSLWKRAAAVHKYCPVIWCKYITCALRCAQHDTALDLQGIFLQAIEHVGSHPAAVDLWRLVLETDLVDKDLLASLFSRPSPGLDILWRKVEGSKHPSVETDGEVHALMRRSKEIWAQKEPFENRLVTEYSGQDPKTAGATTAVGALHIVYC